MSIAVLRRAAHDLTAARELVLPTLYPHAARGLPGLADKGYTGAGSASTSRSSAHPGVYQRSWTVTRC
jgi:hypothetical protein